MKPYYDDGQITIYHGDCREILPTLEPVDLVLTDPPYGINYRSGHIGKLPRQIVGDVTSELRDWLLNHRLPKPLACFATWRCQPPSPPRGCLVWHKSVGGMGDLAFPWSPTFELIWIYGDGWKGHRGDAVLTSKTIVTWNTGPARRLHPHEKPVDLMEQLLLKAPNAGTILDPFMGSGTTLRAAKDLGRRAIGIEIEERYCEVAVKRLAQEVLPLGFT